MVVETLQDLRFAAGGDRGLGLAGQRWRQESLRPQELGFFDERERERDNTLCQFSFLVFIFLIGGVVNQGQLGQVYLSNHVQCRCHFLHLSVYQSSLQIQATIGFIVKLCLRNTAHWGFCLVVNIFLCRDSHNTSIKLFIS